MYPKDIGAIVNIGGVEKRCDRIFVNVAGTWKEFLLIKDRVAGVWKYLHIPVYRLTISANQNNYNIYSAIGSPGHPAFCYVTINNGVTIGSTTPTTAALLSGAFPAGSGIHLINNGGSIIGAGGVGGNGANWAGGYTGDPNGVWNIPGAAGGDGGDAINTECSVTVDNGGYIFGGGGGGGGGGKTCYHVCTSYVFQDYNGNGGGGGAGSTPGSGGTGFYGNGASQEGANGSAGSTTGGAGGFAVPNPQYIGPAYGGDGGGYGQSGASGADYKSGSSDTLCTAPNTVYGTAGLGGAAGQAIKLNGNSINWISGNNSSQVKGAVA